MGPFWFTEWLDKDASYEPWDSATGELSLSFSGELSLGFTWFGICIFTDGGNILCCIGCCTCFDFKGWHLKHLLHKSYSGRFVLNIISVLAIYCLTRGRWFWDKGWIEHVTTNITTWCTFEYWPRLDHLCYDAATQCNPLKVACYMDEDAVGQVKRLASRAHPKNLAEQVLSRYAAYVCVSDGWEEIQVEFGVQLKHSICYWPLNLILVVL